MYYLNSRYYNPEIGRFINADGIMVSNINTSEYNLYEYCCNNPIRYVDNLGAWTGSIFVDFNLTCIVGVSIGIGISFDDNGNAAVQWDYSYPNSLETLTVGVVDFGFSVQVMGTKFDTIYDLCGQSMSIGMAYGNGWYGSLDFVIVPDTIPIEVGGVKVGVGYGGGADVVHFSQTNTQNLYEIYNFSKLQPLQNRLTEFIRFINTIY